VPVSWSPLNTNTGRGPVGAGHNPAAYFKAGEALSASLIPVVPPPLGLWSPPWPTQHERRVYRRDERRRVLAGTVDGGVWQVTARTPTGRWVAKVVALGAEPQ
jgi:hypothetical protein